MTVDPNHEFPDVLTQLSGPQALYPPGGAYPAIANSGFVASFAALNSQSPGVIMQCYSPNQLPVIKTLCQESRFATIGTHRFRGRPGRTDSSRTPRRPQGSITVRRRRTSSFTQRDANANNLLSLVSLAQPQEDTPATLRPPAPSGVSGCDPISFLAETPAAIPTVQPPSVTRPEDSIDEQNVPGFCFPLCGPMPFYPAQGALRAILARFNTIKTRADAAQYVSEVQPSTTGS